MMPPNSLPSGLTPQMPAQQAPISPTTNSGQPTSPNPGPDNHALAMAQWQKINKAYMLTAHVVKTLTKLHEMGDIIEPDDVVDATAGLVGHGAMSAKEAAAGLSDMPTEPGAALAGWVANHHEAFQNHLAQLKQANSIATYQLANSAMDQLAKHHLAQQTAQGPTSAMDNSLSPMVH